MNRRNKALVQYALVAAAALAAASVWSQNRPEQGLLLDAQTWQEEVMTASTGDWPRDGWYRIVAQDRGVEVRAVRPGEGGTVASDALYFRLPGTALRQGLRAGYDGRYTLRVDEVAAGLQYAIGYGQVTYTYLLGPNGTQSSVRAVADLDGDSRPDFVVDTEEATYLLLSTQARPGLNVPTAEIAFHGC